MHEFVSQMAVLLPEADRGPFLEIVKKAEAAVDDHVARGVKAGSDYNQAMDQARARLEEANAKLAQNTKYYNDLTGWKTRAEKDLADRAAALATREAAAGHGNGNGNGNPNPAPGSGDSKTYLTREEMDQREQGMASFFIASNALQREHYAQFGEILDLSPLMNHAQATTLGLRGVYQIVHKERLEKHASEAQAKRDAELKKQGVSEYLAANPNTTVPYPVGGEDTSPLAGLSATDPNAYGVDAAVALFRQNRAVNPL